RGRRRVGSPGDIWVHQRVRLRDDRSGVSLAGLFPLAVDQRKNLFVKGKRRDREFPVSRSLGETRQEIEELRCVMAKLRARGKEADVGVDLRGLTVVVAGSDVNVAAHRVALA